MQGARILLSKATNANLYLLLLHWPPEVPLPERLHGYTQKELVGEEVEAMLVWQVVHWDMMYKEITERLHDNNIHMVKHYLSNLSPSIDV